MAICLLAMGFHVNAGAKAQEPAPAAAGAPSPGQPSPSIAPELQPAAIEAQIEQVESDQELAAEERTNLVAIYKQALVAVKAAEQWRIKAARFDAQTESAPDDIEAARTALAAKVEPRPVPSSLAELEPLLKSKEAELKRLEQLVSESEAAPAQRANRRNEIPKRRVEIEAELADLQKQIAATSSLQTATARANQTFQLARHAELTAEAAALEQEIESYDARSELLPLRRDLAERQLAAEEQFTRQLRDKIAVELKVLAEEAQCEAAAAHPAVRRLAEEYARLAGRRSELTDEVDRIKAQASAARDRLATLQDQRQRTEDRVDRTGLNTTFGALLAKQRNQLPNRRDLERNIASRSEQIDQIKLAQYELEDSLKLLADAAEEEEAHLSKLRATVGETDLWSYLQAELLNLLAKRREIHHDLLNAYTSYVEAIDGLDAAERDILRERDEFAAFINQRVLWLPNMPAVGPRDVAGAWHMLQWFGRPGDWLELVQGLAADAADRPLTTFAFLVSLVALAVFCPRLREYVKEIGKAATKGSFDQFSPTLYVMGASTLLAVPAAWVMAYAAWRMTNLDISGRLAVPVSSGLGAAALVVLVAELWRQFFRSDGLAEAHFGWSENSLRAIRARIGHWMVPVAVFVFLVAAMSAIEEDQQAASLGRVAFVIGMLASIVPIYRTLDPRQWLLKDFLAWNRDGWLYRLRYVWFVGFVLAPPSLALLAILGYYHTALELTVRAFVTLCFGAGLIITREIIFRALLIARRRLAMEQTRQRRAAARAAAEAAEESSAGESQSIAFEAPLLDLSAISGQTRRLVRAVLVMTALVATYGIWVDVLPALAVLDRIVLWPTESGDAITLKSALFATLIGMLTFVAWKNIPGLLEIAVLQKLPLEASSRFAVATLTSYIIAVIGTVLTFNQFGIGWRNVQWLVAAMTVGLGFGLQEIFANFVSGLIILFERPIRVGDVVTTGDVTGAVTKIRVRATTITNWDRKELIIPNKEFVTGRVMNWTLSDQVNRVTINVHVGYSTDATEVLTILQQVAEQHPLIIKDPSPMASFEEFGTSSLTFVLHAYLPTLDVRQKTVTELHSTIQRRFADAGIEFAFPQQDIHVRSIDASLPFLTRLAESEEAA